jgi:DNA-directed RNA polymerase sigma subunit (sigma70/sigma32)
MVLDMTPLASCLCGKGGEPTTEEVARVYAAFRGLPGLHQAVLRQRFGLDGQPPVTLQFVAEQRADLTRERVRQIESFALQRLARELEA